MANTVNDVMNVIASPDFGIRNIAGTNQEILAILSGTHNSKNNIHNIVDDIRALLQKLSTSSIKNKAISIIDSPSAKTNYKHVQNILDETISIKKAIDNLAVKIMKQAGNNMPAVAKLSNKASDKVADAMIKDMSKQSKNGGLTSIIQSFSKLKEISLKDIIFGKRKIKIISKIFKNASDELKVDEKDITAIAKLIGLAPDMMKSLKKVGRRLKSIIKNNVIKNLSNILIGKKGSILSLSQDLQKNEQLFEKAATVAKNLSDFASAISKSMRKLLFAALWAKLANSAGAKSLNTVIDNNLIPLTQKLTKSKGDIDKGTKIAKDMSVFVGNLLLMSIFLTISVVTAGPAILGSILLSVMVDRIIPIAQKLSKNQKSMSNASTAAIMLTAFTGLMTLTAILLDKVVAVGLGAIVGALLLSVIIDVIVPVAKKLSKTQKVMDKALGASIVLVAFTGIMTLTALLLNKVASVGVGAILGTIILYGIVTINIYTFKALEKSLKNIIVGAIGMIIMSVSLLLFGVALQKIVNATKDVDFKQVAIIASLTIILGGVVAILGIPAVSPFIIMGSMTMAIMSVSLLLFGVALGKITAATKDVDFKQVAIIASLPVLLGGVLAGLGIPFFSGLIILGAGVLSVMSVSLLMFGVALGKLVKSSKSLSTKKVETIVESMELLASGIGGMALYGLPVALGSLTLTAMGFALKPIVKILKSVSEIKENPKKKVEEMLDAVRAIGEFFSNNSVGFKAILSAKMYKKILKPFGSAVKQLAKLNEMGIIPVDMVNDSLECMLNIGEFYTENPIDKSVIKESNRYLVMMKPFSKTVKHLAKLKKLGNVPMKLVYNTLESMFAIGEFYLNNPIDSDVIKEAKRYRKMMKPFGKTVDHLSKLKKMGAVPLKLVYNTLEAMLSIGEFYIDNPIKKKVIKEAKRYRKMMKPFGKTVDHLSKLKKMGSIPLKLVYGTLDAMLSIGEFYINNPIEKKVIKEAKRYMKMMKPFSVTVFSLSLLKKMGGVNVKHVSETLDAIRLIANFYMTQDPDIDIDDAEETSELISGVITSFGEVVEAMKILHGMKGVPVDAINDSITAIDNIIWFYDTVYFPKGVKFKSEMTKYVVGKFGEVAKVVQDNLGNAQAIDKKAVKSIVSTCRSIIRFYNWTPVWAKEEKVEKINKYIKQFAENAESLKKGTQDFTESNYNSNQLMIKSMAEITLFLASFSLEDEQKAQADKTLELIAGVSSSMTELSKIDMASVASVGDTLSNTISGVNAVDVSQVEAVTNMFNAFSKINNSENLINKFTESVKEFTDACERLIDAMNNNSDGETSEAEGTSDYTQFDSMGTDSNGTGEQNKPGIRISNVDELALTIAEKINGVLSVEVPDSQVQLMINGSGGNEWTITRY